MGQWTCAELEQAFDDYQAAVEKACASGDWEHFVQCFAEDATYVEHAYGEFAGHDQIRDWITRTMGTFPGNEMNAFPIAWSVVDEERGWIVCEIRNLMRDPGDGSVHEASNLTILRYAGGGRWREEEDVYNPAHFLTMVTEWMRVASAHGTLSEEGRRWAAAVGIEL